MTTNIDRKYQILESLESLNSIQSAKVLDYIKGLTEPTAEEIAYQSFKREAMKEIRNALAGKRKLRLSF
jgi:hypothetical protein